LSDPIKVRRLVTQYYGKPGFFTGIEEKIGQREKFQYFDEKEKEWVDAPKVYEYHYVYGD